MRAPVRVRKGETLAPGFLVSEGSYYAGAEPAPHHGTKGVAVVLEIIEHRGAVASHDDTLHFHGPWRH